MANQLRELLANWYPQRDRSAWVLGTVYQTRGPSYRKAGAMMLFNSDGQQFGMLSGGCLESDIQIHARKVMASGKTQLLCYDGSDEDDLSFQLGIGCGGTVYLQLQLVDQASDYLALDSVYRTLKSRQTGWYRQKINPGPGAATAHFDHADISRSTLGPRHARFDEQGWLHLAVIPEPHLLVVGGGIDARPLVSMARQLGWQVSLWDPRPANARREFFADASQILRGDAADLTPLVAAQRIDAAMLLTHNLSLDAEALRALHNQPLGYLALLGPAHRRQQVMAQAGLRDRDLATPLAGPAGLDLGGELPESLALAMLSECHACLQRRDGRSLSLPSLNPSLADPAPLSAPAEMTH